MRNWLTAWLYAHNKHVLVELGVRIGFRFLLQCLQRQQPISLTHEKQLKRSECLVAIKYCKPSLQLTANKCSYIHTFLWIYIYVSIQDVIRLAPAFYTLNLLKIENRGIIVAAKCL